MRQRCKRRFLSTWGNFKISTFQRIFQLNLVGNVCSPGMAKTNFLAKNAFALFETQKDADMVFEIIQGTQVRITQPGKRGHLTIRNSQIPPNFLKTTCNSCNKIPPFCRRRTGRDSSASCDCRSEMWLVSTSFAFRHEGIHSKVRKTKKLPDQNNGRKSSFSILANYNSQI